MVEIIENFKNQRLPAFVLVGVLPVTLLFHIIGISIPQWVKISGYKEGLWEYCDPSCTKHNCKPDWLSSSGAFAIISTLCLVGALVCLAVITTTKIFEKNPSTILMCSLCTSAAFFTMLTWGIYVGNTDKKDHLDAGFGLVVFGWILQIACCLISLISFREFSSITIGQSA
ncbi:DgyrCDS13875 [Dimorphilus gyrociliatus]|uniref:DgyrCDS13875 n=1 Tax=Dimorphilus gyrociliatus TaxID=2664684 RepID=A0A7I8WBZ1_9ANNE|nr:DgyrCDS13875 [Dimorphilus gyrociliatus]